MPVKPAKHLKHAEERHRPITAPHCCCFHTNAGICLTLNDEYCGSDELVFVTLSVVYLTSVLIVTSILAMAIVVTVTSVVTVMSVVAVKSVRIMRG